jgi:hypothetical protein
VVAEEEQGLVEHIEWFPVEEEYDADSVMELVMVEVMVVVKVEQDVLEVEGQPAVVGAEVEDENIEP